MKFLQSIWAAVIAVVLLPGSVVGILPPQNIPIGEIAAANFLPLSCYDATATCTSFSAKAYDLTQVVIIPCDECVTFDLPDGQTYNLLNGLDIQGKLVFPKNKKATIYTPFVHVQGVLEITNDEKVSSEPSLSFVLTGTSDVFFTPHVENSASCAGGSCNTGKKSFVVAGGRLDITALKEDCPTWVKLLDAIPAATPVVPADYPQLPMPSSDLCREVVAENFESGAGPFKSSLGSVGSIRSGPTSDYYSVSSRTQDWQGPFFTFDQFTREPGCVMPNQPYLFKASYRLAPETLLTNSNCHANGTHCLSLDLHTLASDGNTMTFRTLFETPAIARSTDNTWTDFVAIVQFTAVELQADTKYQMLSLSGPEAGIGIEIDDVLMRLPQEDMFPNPDGPICSNLITNGDASLDLFAYPFLLDSTVRAYLSVKREDNNGIWNSYFSISGRTTSWTSITQDLIIDCIPKYSVYNFKAKVRVHSLRDIAVRLTLKTYTTATDYIIESVGVCPLTSTSIGWVECSNSFMFKDVHASATRIVFSFVVEGELYADVDYDDISITLESAPINKFVVPEEVARCWDTGASILQTSHTLDHSDHNVLEISNIETDSKGRAVLTLSEAVAKPTTDADDPRVATEIALLSRNVKITGANDDPVNQNHGASMMIVKTENVAQKIQGVQFYEMGQQGNLGRYVSSS